MKPKVGVMGSSAPFASEEERARAAEIAERLGRAIAYRDCILVTGATTGIPRLVSIAAHEAGAMTVGISPASNENEHVERFHLPTEGHDVIVYTGFGLKGRNVINIRSSDIVIIFGGGIGTLNELTIAYDECRIVGVLRGTGGIADHADEVIGFCKGGRRLDQVFIDENPESLLDKCIDAFLNGASD